MKRYASACMAAGCAKCCSSVMNCGCAGSPELAGLEDAMNKNAQLVTRPGDLDSKHHLEGLRDRQGVRVEKYHADIAAAESYLAPLIQKSGRRLLETSIGSSEQLPLRIQKEKSKIKV